jgi:hypothetical protein
MPDAPDSPNLASVQMLSVILSQAAEDFKVMA